MADERSFEGYLRRDGRAGTRNLVGILATVVCANEVADAIQRQVPGTAAFMHQQGCSQSPVDIATVSRALAGLGGNPNLASVLLVSLGCESVEVEAVARAIEAGGKRVERVVIQELGGASKAIARGRALAQELVAEAAPWRRQTCPASQLVLGLKCGSSDTTSGLFANPALGVASDLLVGAGGTSVLGEVTEFIGAEHLLAGHAADPSIARKILALVERMEARAKAGGCDIRGGQPTGGNIKGGITTLEEKSLGAITKAGRSPIRGVFEYGAAPDVKGLVVMDSPGREPELLTGLAAAGCTLIAFTTGRGAPQGFPFVPVVKITGNGRTWAQLPEHMDVDVSGMADGLRLAEAGERIYASLLQAASGRPTKAELTGYTRSMDIYTVGPVL
jgi:altronate dehydratase large subunit